MWREIKAHPVRFFALLCVMATAAFLGYMSERLVSTVESSGWCAKALQAERISSQNFGGLTACNDLLKIQIEALATALHISISSFAGVLLVLVIVVVAGAKGSFTLPGGTGGSVGPAQAADQVADAAADKADQIKGEAS